VLTCSYIVGFFWSWFDRGFVPFVVVGYIVNYYHVGINHIDACCC